MSNRGEDTSNSITVRHRDNAAGAIQQAGQEEKCSLLDMLFI